MSRIRNIKPAFFKDSELYDAEAATGLPLRVAYAGLWTVADREGRFKWKPREIGTDVLPYDNLDMGTVLDALVKCGKIFKYKAAGFDYGFIPNFGRHQFINKNEVQSQLPEPPTNIIEYSDTNLAPVLHLEYTGGLDTDTDNNLTSDKSDPSKPEVKSAGRKNPYPEAFETFWRDYPTDALMSKKKAYEQWKRLTEADREAAHAAVPGFRAHCQKNTTYRPVHAQRFLSERRFDGFKGEKLDAETKAANMDRADKLMRRGKYAEGMQ